MISTTDPITGTDIVDPTGNFFVVEGDRYHEVTSYSESDATRAANLDIPIERHGLDEALSLDIPTDYYPDVNSGS